MDVAENVQEEKVFHDFLEWRQSLRSLTEIGAWRDSSRNLIVSGGDGQPVNVAEMSVSGFRVAAGEPPGPGAGRSRRTTRGARLAGDWLRRVAHAVRQRSTRARTRRAARSRGRHGGRGHARASSFRSRTTCGCRSRPLFSINAALRPAITVFALLAPGETMQTAQAELTTAGRRAATESPATHRHLEPRVRPCHDDGRAWAPGDQPIARSTFSTSCC